MTLLKQEKVPCLSDSEARLALDPKDPFKLMTKPHGHGDVHYLLHSSGTVNRWSKVRTGPKRASGERMPAAALWMSPAPADRHLSAHFGRTE